MHHAHVVVIIIITDDSIRLTKPTRSKGLMPLAH
jgi:hypothetical protein